MTFLTPVASLDPVPQLETSTAALGGPGGPMNAQAQALLNRLTAIVAMLAATGGAGAVGISGSGTYPEGSIGAYLLNMPATTWKNVPPPPAPPTVAAGSAGALTGTYYYSVAFETAVGVTEGCFPSAGVTVAAQRVNLSAVPVSADPAVIARRIYRTPATAPDSILAQYVGRIADNVTTTFVDNVADGSLGAPVPKSNSTGGLLKLNGSVIGSAGLYSTRFGRDALPSDTAYANDAFGSNSMRNATTAYRNSGFGIDTLFALTTGARNAAGGVHTLSSITTADDNAGWGYGVLQNSTASFNAGIGSLVLSENTTGTNNFGGGAFALQLNTVGLGLTATGSNSLRNLTSGTGNTSSGAFSSYFLLDGDFNTHSGFQAGYNATHTTGSTSFGALSLWTNVVGQGNVAMGPSSGYWETGDNHLWLDNQPRANLADARVKALVYGTFAVAVADQQLTINGQLNANAGIGMPVTGRKTAAYTMLATDSIIHVQGTASVPLTLLSGPNQVGRIVTVCNYAAFTVVSASANVIPQGGSAAGTAILAATAGKWCDMQFDGTNWQVIRSN